MLWNGLTINTAQQPYRRHSGLPHHQPYKRLWSNPTCACFGLNLKYAQAKHVRTTGWFVQDNRSTVGSSSSLFWLVNGPKVRNGWESCPDDSSTRWTYKSSPIILTLATLLLNLYPHYWTVWMREIENQMKLESEIQEREMICKQSDFDGVSQFPRSVHCSSS